MRFEEAYSGWNEGRLAQFSNRRKPVDEVMALMERYRSRHSGWNVKHFHSWYKPKAAHAATRGSKSACNTPLVPKTEKQGVHQSAVSAARWRA